MIVGVLTTCHTKYNSDRNIYFYLIKKHSLQVLYMYTLCDSTHINTIIEFVPNCLQHVSGDGFSGGSDLYLQFWDSCGKRRNINLILDVTPQKEITWGCIWRTRRQVVKTPTIISNNPVFVNYNCVATQWQQYSTHLHTHTHTQYTERHKTNNTQNTTKILEECRLCPFFAGFALAFALHLRKKHGETSVRVAEECKVKKYMIRTQHMLLGCSHEGG